MQGLKLAYVGPDTSYLLYSGLWFPVAGYGVNRFTSTINVTVPSHMLVIGSGKEPIWTAGTPATPRKSRQRSREFQDFHLHVGQAEFSRHDHCAGTFQEYKSDEAGLDLHVFFKRASESRRT